MRATFLGLDSNFIKPNLDNYVDIKVQGTTVKTIRGLLSKAGGEIDIESIQYKDSHGVIDTNLKTKLGAMNDLKEKYGYEKGIDVTDEVKEYKSTDNSKYDGSGALSQQRLETVECAWLIEEDGKSQLYLVIRDSHTVSSGSAGGSYIEQHTTASLQISKIEATVDELKELLEEAGEIANIGDKVLDRKTSTAGQLQGAISTWYKALRVIALVGLLSVLVYVGIRIILSSTGQEKAKYKKMITDWLVAICLLFILHYIMAFTMQITESILDIFNNNEKIIGTDGQDVLMSEVRSDLSADGIDAEDPDFVTLFSKIVIYIVLVIYTVMFIIQYLKRVVMLAFLTMVAPLITLTYPLDKIKDGQAQAFSMWIREYIFNALLPVMHMILYYMLVGSAMDFVTTGGNWIYAVVAIGFLMPAEKFFRKMFGFDKATTANQLGAATGGALVMNAINKMGQNSGKKAAGKSGGAGESGSGSGGSTPRYISAPGTTGGGASGGGSGSGSGGTTGGAARSASTSGGTTVFGESVSDPSPKIKGSFVNGAKTLGGHYFNRGNAKKLAKGAGRMARRGAVGALGAATLGTVGLAAGVATGDLGNAFKYGAAGAGAGYMGANALGDKAVQFGSEGLNIAKEGAFGTDEYNTRNSVKELTNDNDFNKVCKDLGITDQKGREQLIRQFHSNGITSSQDIKKAMNVRAGNAGTSQAEIIAAQKIRQQAKQYGMKSKDIKESLKKDKGLSKDDIDRAMNLIDQL